MMLMLKIVDVDVDVDDNNDVDDDVGDGDNDQGGLVVLVERLLTRTVFNQIQFGPLEVPQPLHK